MKASANVSVNVFAAILLITIGCSAAFADTAPPSPQVRAKIVSALSATMERLDGEALYVRKNRSISWKDIASERQQEATEATSWFDFMRALVRLDQSYPNLHSSAKPGRDAMRHVPRRVIPKVGFFAEWVAPHTVRYTVSSVAPDAHYISEDLPRTGDEIIAINGRDMPSWQAEHFESCKFPLRAQCDFLLPSNFQRELLSWTRDDLLTYTLKRGERVWTIPVGLKESGTYFPQRADEYCKLETTRYQEGFVLVYSGNRACVYESSAHPGVAILRITSFTYAPDTLEKNESITSVPKEIDALYPWWKQHATWKHLIVDIIDNHGGEAPIEYYQILFRHKFQEQYVTFKKTKEMENPTLRHSVFWGSRGQEIWFQKLIANRAWSKLSYGAYTPPVPMFCANQQKDCSVGTFPVRQHPFKGRISVLLNQWCVSSCDGLAYNLKEKFGSNARYFGHPQAADTAYARLTINVVLDEKQPDGFKLAIVPLGDSSSQNAFMSQTVVVSRSTLANGAIVSGKPVALDQFVPNTLENADAWPNAVLKAALVRTDFWDSRR